jgi:thiamine pyrophosphate-dependent acetolactate synthase large subunit-like protein
MHQEREGRSTRTSELGPVDFSRVAEACGAVGLRVESDEAVEPALREAIAARRPTVVQLRVDPAWVSVDQHP